MIPGPGLMEGMLYILVIFGQIGKNHKYMYTTLEFVKSVWTKIFGD